MSAKEGSSAAGQDTGRDLYTLSPHDIKKLSRSQKIQILRELRVRPLRRPTVALMCATDVLSGGSSGLAEDEVHNVREQALIAALECGQCDQAQHQLKVLQSTFSMQSLRVQKLAGLVKEAQGQLAEARKIYSRILSQQPDDPFAVKRLSAMLKGTGDIKGAIEVLERRSVYVDDDGNELTFTQVHALDSGANKELCMLYLQEGNIEKALFYAEECILCDPFDYALHARHGELAYSAKQYDRAIAAFAQSLRLNDAPNNTRAAYGLLMSARAMVKDKNNNNAEHYKALVQSAATRLNLMYADSGNRPVVDLMLKEM